MKKAKMRSTVNNMDLEKMAEKNPGLRDILEAQGTSLSTTKEREEMVRVQLDFSLAKIELLTELMKKGDIKTRKDLFNNALTLFAWALAEREKGNYIFSTDEAGEYQKELVMHPLENAATLARRMTPSNNPPPPTDPGWGDDEDEEDSE